MKTATLQFDSKQLNMLRGLKNRYFKEYICQPQKEEFTALYNIGLLFDEISIKLVNDFVVRDINGAEDYASLSVKDLDDSPLEKYIQNVSFCSYSINSIVRDLQIITDTICWEEDADKYQMTFDVGLVFTLENNVLVFQKEVWFSEEIVILQGQNYKENLLPTHTGWDFEPDAHAVFQREIKTL